MGMGLGPIREHKIIVILRVLCKVVKEILFKFVLINR